MQSLPKVLLIEDDRAIAKALRQALATTYQIDHVESAKRGLYETEGELYDAIVLDLQLPDMSGLEVCRQLRERGVTTPIIILSAESKVLSKIQLLDAGANDYLTKPFSLGELKARLRALARVRPMSDSAMHRLQVSGIVLDAGRHIVSRDGVNIILRRKEFALLECLMEHAGNVVTRGMLQRYAWHGHDEPWTNTIDVHIKHLRDKVDRPFDRPLIRTVHGLGYKLVADPDAKVTLRDR